tara:strand:+ start:309 stop:794 length:486 start_codon:yes stop_codon:yes gene_type:complete
MEYTMRGKLIKGFPDYVIYPDGKVYNCKIHQIMKTCNDRTDDSGYDFIKLSDGKGNRKQKKIHRLVAEHFIDNPDNKPFVDHIDRNKLNNDISNLRWVTASENGQNTGMSKNNTSGIKNISFDKRRNNWRYRKCINNLKYSFNNKNKQVVLWCMFVHSLLS